MTNLITLTIPNDDHIALREFGKALIEIASEKDGHPVDVTITPLVISTETLQQAAPQMTDELRFKCNKDFPAFEIPSVRTVDGSYPLSPSDLPEIDTTAQQVESLGATHIITEQKLVGDPIPLGDGNFSQGYIATVEEIADPVDSTGTPWDERIHSASKALNADGTWRLRRKPKDMDEAQWAKYIEAVKTDVTDANDDSWDTDRRPGSGGNGGVGIGESDDVEPPVTPPGDDFHTDADVVTEQTVAGIPPLPVPPPVVVAPPVPEVTEWDFPRLMTFLTERHGKIDVTTVNTLLAQDGMSSVQELNANPGKIGPFVARVKAHLGE